VRSCKWLLLSDSRRRRFAARSTDRKPNETNNRKSKWDTPLRPHGFWKTGKFNTWRNRYEKTSGRRHNGFVPVGVDKNGHPIAANSYDSCLAQLDDVYAREMQFEKELSKESE